MTNFRALCEELVDVLADHCGDNEFAWGLVDRACAALAEQPVAEGPPAVTISDLLHPGYELCGGGLEKDQLVDGDLWRPAFGCDSLQKVVDNARSVLALPTPEATVHG